MSESERHQTLKKDLLDWLQKDTQPQCGLRWSEIAFQCNDHIHFWNIPPWAAFADSERWMPHPEGGRCKPDVVLLDYQAKPLAMLEVKHTNRVNRVYSAALHLSIPYFRFDCPPEGSTTHELWVRQNETWFSGAQDGFHASYQGEMGADGHIVYPGPIEVAGNQPGQVIMGPIAWANSTNLTCEGATWLQHQNENWGRATHYRDARAETAREIGQNLMREIEMFRRNPYHWSAGIGEIQLAGTIGIYHLNKEATTGKYPPCDITSLLDKWGNENIAMHKALAEKNKNQQPRPNQMFRG